MQNLLSADRLSAFRRTLRLVCLCALCLLSALLLDVPHALAEKERVVIHPGYRTLSASIPEERLLLQMGVWYPTARRPGNVKAGDWSFRAARNGAVLKGPWPVIVLSHDVTGSAWSHHDVASSLAARGFIVAAPLHDRDNADDMRMLFTEHQLPQRALQLSAALDAVLQHPQIGEQADREKVCFLGFGLTAPSGLLLAGGRLDPEGLSAFYEDAAKKQAPANASDSAPATPPDTQVSPSARPGAVRPSPWSTPLLTQKLDALASGLQQSRERAQEQAVLQEKAVSSREATFARIQDSMKKRHQRQMRLARAEGIPCPPSALPLLPALPARRSSLDPRFKAAVFVSPGFSMLFTEQSLAEARIPMLFVGAGEDTLNPPHEQAERFVAMLPGRAELLLLADASPAVLHAPCPEADKASRLGGVCAPVSAEVRQRVRTSLLDTMQGFFLRFL